VEILRLIAVGALVVTVGAAILALSRSQEALLALREEARLYGSSTSAAWLDGERTSRSRDHKAKLRRAMGQFVACLFLIGVIHLIS